MKSFVKFTAIIIVLFSSFNFAEGQKYMTKTGHAYFMSHTDAIDIDGHNYQVASIADLETGDIVVIVLIKAFEFSLATADKHFNETYMESDEFAKATFKGNIPVLKGLDVSKNGEYQAAAEGKLTIHGQTQDIKKEGIIKVIDGILKIECKFDVLIADYEIKVPKSVEDRVAQQVDVEIDLSLSLKQ